MRYLIHTVSGEVFDKLATLLTDRILLKSDRAHWMAADIQADEAENLSKIEGVEVREDYQYELDSTP